MQRLELSSNFLNGTLPSELGSLSNLKHIGLGHNDLSGNIPEWLSSLSNLEYIGLGYNNLSGTLLSELGNLSNLKFLHLNNNDLNGNIPSELGNLSNLAFLYLNNNDLSGNIPEGLGDLPLLQLHLYNNALSGTLPESIKDLSANKRLENRPYVITEILDAETTVGLKFNLDVSKNFGDINDNITSYGAKGLPNGLTINSSSGAISGTPITAGSFEVTVTVSDTAGGSVKDEFEIEVSTGYLDATDYAALKALYESTGGTKWRNSQGWDFSSDTPPLAKVVDNWHGVTVQGSRVKEIVLNKNNLSGTVRFVLA